ncbi:MAG: hypothetical protein IPP42_11785 [Saprospiraceae bacterium]|nr:hypothetical protein [Saprospiraceae bacterium]
MKNIPWLIAHGYTLLYQLPPQAFNPAIISTYYILCQYGWQGLIMNCLAHQEAKIGISNRADVVNIIGRLQRFGSLFLHEFLQDIQLFLDLLRHTIYEYIDGIFGHLLDDNIFLALSVGSDMLD